MVFYRKYRPQKIDELDSRLVREKLEFVLKSEVPHAMLFTGPKGLGKTSTARIVAKAINCETKQNSKKQMEIEPCGKCSQCESIMNGTNMDVVEIDAASNRGIDEIRALKEKIWLTPLKSAKKVYIIDEVHMLTTEAFNALLKTLEEPPNHAVFILCTTEPQKLPSTILSRCFHISFNKANSEEIGRSLKRIIKGEQITIDPKEEKYILDSIAARADGGFRDAAKLLEELVISSKDKKITKELIESVFGADAMSASTEKFLRHLAKRDLKEALILINDISTKGLEMKYFITDCLENLHSLLLSQAGVKTAKDPGTIAISIEEIKLITELLSRAHSETKSAVIAQLPLELAVIEYCSLFPKQEKPEIIEKEPVNTITTMRKKAGELIKLKALYGDKSEEKTVTQTVKQTVELMHVPAGTDVTAQWLDSFWKNLIEDMKKHNHTVAGVLRSCKIGSFDKKKLVITTGYNFHKERLDDMKARTALQNACKVLTGNEVEIEIQLTK